MEILISADMEGATGVTWPADWSPVRRNGSGAGRCSTLTHKELTMVEGIQRGDIDAAGYAPDAQQVAVKGAAGPVRRALRIRDDPLLQGGVHADLGCH